MCCRTKPLKTLLRDDWSKNDDEEWGESDLGPCKTMLYKVGWFSGCILNTRKLEISMQVRDGIRFTLLKNGIKDILREKPLCLFSSGKDDLQVNKLVLGTENLRGAKFSYDCKDFKLASQGTQCVVRKPWKGESLICSFSGRRDL